MNRRKFLSTLIGGVATAAAVRTFPFRVYSFPKEIKTGNMFGLRISPYPGRLATPHLIGRGCALTPEMLREMQRRVQRIYLYGCTV
jgi:hypothetical protein